MGVSSFPLPEEDGVELVVAVLRDMTARKEAEDERDRLFAEAQRRAAELDAAIDSIPEGAVIYGPEGEILRMNSAAGRWLAFSAHQADRPVAEKASEARWETAEGKLLPADETPALRALRGETVRGAVLRCPDCDGRPAWFSCSAAPIRAPDGTLLGAIALFDDITALHDLEEQREDFLRIVSHDLRSPLVSIGGFAQRLRRQFEEAGVGESEQKCLKFIVEGANQMGSIIQDLVDSTRLESGQVTLERVPVALGGFVADLFERSGEALGVGRIRLEVPPGLPPVAADPHHLERVLTNLVTNALKYSPPKTSVVLAAERLGDEVTVSVIDCGPGIGSEDLPRLFEKFYRAEGARKAEGLGLGLYITKMLVEAQGGRIWAESRPGEGSTFRFTLPVAPAP
jgi:PAS domain S-box-containing protein